MDITPPQEQADADAEKDAAPEPEETHKQKEAQPQTQPDDGQTAPIGPSEPEPPDARADQPEPLIPRTDGPDDVVTVSRKKVRNVVIVCVALLLVILIPWSIKKSNEAKIAAKLRQAASEIQNGNVEDGLAIISDVQNAEADELRTTGALLQAEQAFLQGNTKEALGFISAVQTPQAEAMRKYAILEEKVENVLDYLKNDGYVRVESLSQSLHTNAETFAASTAFKDLPDTLQNDVQYIRYVLEVFPYYANEGDQMGSLRDSMYGMQQAMLMITNIKHSKSGGPFITISEIQASYQIASEDLGYFKKYDLSAIPLINDGLLSNDPYFSKDLILSACRFSSGSNPSVGISTATRSKTNMLKSAAEDTIEEMKKTETDLHKRGFSDTENLFNTEPKDSYAYEICSGLNKISSTDDILENGDKLYQMIWRDTVTAFLSFENNE